LCQKWNNKYRIKELESSFKPSKTEEEAVVAAFEKENAFEIYFK